MTTARTSIALLLFGGCFAVPAPPEGRDDDTTTDTSDDDEGDPTTDPTDPGPDAGPRPDASPTATALELSQTTSKTIRNNHALSCEDDSGHHGEQSFYRAFDLGQQVPGKRYRVQKVEFGIEVANDSGGQGQLAYVRVHRLSGALSAASIVEANLTQVAVVADVVTDTSLTTRQVDLSAEFAAGDIVVAEVFLPDGHIGGATNRLVIGSNNAGQTGPSYTKNVCGTNSPTSMATAHGGDFADVHVVLSLHGESF